MKTCPNCGAQNEDDFTLCGICGATLGESQPAFSLKSDEQVQNRVDSMQEEQPADNQYYYAGTDQNQMAGGAYQNYMYQNQGGGYENQGNGYENQGYGYPDQAQPYYANASQSLFNGQNDMGNLAANRAPVAADKKKIFIALGVMAVVLIAAFVVVFSGFSGGKNKGAKSPEEVVELYVKGINERDSKILDSIAPSFSPSVSNNEQAQDLLDQADAYDMVYDYTIKDTSYYTDSEVSELEDMIKDNYTSSAHIDDACDVDMDMNVEMTYMGQTYSQDAPYTLTTIKVDDRWYVFDPVR